MIPKGSVFEHLILSAMDVGALCESTAMSETDRCIAGSYAEREGTVASPLRKNPKKQVHAAAHSIRLLNVGPCDSHERRRVLSIAAVIGRRGREERPSAAWERLIPCNTYSRPTILQSLGSEPQRVMWGCRTAERYTLIDLCVSACEANTATNRDKDSCVSGNGEI